ncbi:hypothetical protein N431DRAFT_353906 [Stipitochalara longipes BDJ]|nr:hypothetical protein N431DRAFT_353906 [Stipitochalara longipes BDJ]
MTAPSLEYKPVRLSDNITLQTPLSRFGKGPGIILLISKDYTSRASTDISKTLDPEPQQKWAEEGFAVVEVKYDAETIEEDFRTGIAALKKLPESAAYSTVGVIVYELPRSSPLTSIWSTPDIAAVVAFTGQEPSIPTASKPSLFHSTSKSIPPGAGHTYDNVKSTNFILPSHEHYQASPASVAHTRSLGFLKKHLGGPNFDLEAVWDEHTLYEFGERNVEKTMSTMVAEPYMTGGIGRKALTNFYRGHFIFNNPKDTQLELVSRTVGVDRVIDEFIFCFTHDKVIDWLIPGIPPTNKHVRVPFTSVVNVRGDRLYHEHIAWDQASVLRQLGLLPEYLPFPYELPGGRKPGKGKRFEYRVPAAGLDTARKMVDEACVESNEMLGFEIREVDDV